MSQLHRRVFSLNLLCFAFASILSIGNCFAQDAVAGNTDHKQPKDFPNTAEEHAQAMLAVNDKNGDRKLVKSEFLSRNLAQAFDDYDANGDEQLEFSELVEMSKKFSWAKTLKDPIARTVEANDADKDGLLSPKEAEETRYKASFGAIDTDKDGALSKFEIAVFTARSRQGRLGGPGGPGGFRPGFGGNAGNATRGNAVGMRELLAISRDTTDADVQRILKQDDTNKDGKLGKGEARVNLARNFAAFDTNSDGFLDASEIKKTGLRPYGGDVFLEAFDKDGDKFLTKEEAIYKNLADRFESLDTNKDGKLSKTEMDVYRGGMLFRSGRSGLANGLTQAFLNRMDSDADGRVSKKESASVPMFVNNFEKLDSNQDGFLSPEEIDRFREVVGVGQGRVSRPDVFKASDKDGDGKLSKDELPEQFSEIDFATVDEDQDGKISDVEFRQGQRSVLAARFFRRMDQNDDGKLGKEELSGRMQDRFDELDADNNGSLTESEFLKSFEGSRFRGDRPSVLFPTADKDRDGKLSQAEAQHPILRGNFANYDADKDGFLSKAEHTALMKGTAAERYLGAAKVVIERADSNQDGKLQKDEFPSYLSRYTFADVDIDGDGSATAEEYAGFLHNQNDPDGAAQRAFARFDKNGDGQVGKDESPSIWKRVAGYDTDQNGSISEAEFRLGEGKREYQTHVRNAGQRLLGLRLADAEVGLAITRVTPGSPAFAAKIMVGDVLLSIGGETVDSLEQVRSLVSKGPSKQTIKLIRDGKEIERTVEFQGN